MRSAQLSFSNGRSRRPLRRWIAFATSSLPVPDSPRIRIGTSTGAKRSISAKSACITALWPMIPWNEGRPAPAIGAQLPSTGVSTGGQRHAQPHVGHPVRLGAGHYLDCDCGPLAAMPRSSRTVHTGSRPSPSMSTLSNTWSPLRPASLPPQLLHEGDRLREPRESVGHRGGLPGEAAIQVQTSRIKHGERLPARTHQLPRPFACRHPRSPRGRTQKPRATAHAVDSGLWVLELGLTGPWIGWDPTAGLYIGESFRRMVTSFLWA